MRNRPVPRLPTPSLREIKSSACRPKLAERRGESVGGSVHEDSDVSGEAHRAKTDLIFDEPRDQKTRVMQEV
jgi:hypothetical protein